MVGWKRKKAPKEEPFQRHKDDDKQVDPEGSRRKVRWRKNSKQVDPRDPEGGSAYNPTRH